MRSLRIAGCFGISLLSTAIIFGQANEPTLQEPQRKSESSLSKLKGDLVREIDALQVTLDSLNRNVDFLRRILGNTRSPIRVHGGAMTFYTTSKWTQIGSSSTWCTPITEQDARYIDVDGLVASGTPQVQLPTLPQVGWKIIFFGYDAHGTAASNHGILAEYERTPCPGSIDTNRVSVSPLVRADGFYTDTLPPGTPYQDNKRFWDKSRACKFNRDNCERMSSVEMEFNNGTGPQLHNNYVCPPSTPTPCSVGIGVPLQP